MTDKFPKILYVTTPQFQVDRYCGFLNSGLAEISEGEVVGVYVLQEVKQVKHVANVELQPAREDMYEVIE